MVGAPIKSLGLRIPKEENVMGCREQTAFLRVKKYCSVN
jgi:hypothetical protein